MKIIRGNRGQGKTTELVKISNREWKYIVCKDMQRVNVIVGTADKLALDIPYPITVRELPISPRSFIKSVLIDDIEDILPLLIGKGIEYITTSSEVLSIKEETKKWI